ncbi:MAG: TlpA family protein disulfide reductase [Actinomycetaceae bacterium]
MTAGLPRPGRARGAALAVGALALALAGCAPAGTSADGGDVGAGYEAGDGSFTTWDDAERGAPVEMSGTGFDGSEIDLAQLRGQPVVVNFWYAACPPCRVEAPDLAQMAADYEGEIAMLGVNPRDDTGTAQAFENTFSIPYPSVHDQGARAVAAFEGVVPLAAMPTTVVLDQEGRVAARILGQADPTILRGLVDDVIAEG